MTTNSNDVIVSLDVGSSKVLCVVARPGDDKGFHRVLGIGNVRSQGIRQGTVIDVEEAVHSIRKAVSEAQYTSGVKIDRVWGSIGGQTQVSYNCTGAAVPRSREVRQEDVTLAEVNARQNAIQQGQGRDLVKLIPQGYRVGDVIAPRSPVGLTGSKLEALVHAVYGSASNAENLKRCMQRSGLELVDYEPHAWAAAQATLTETEKTCGAAVIDIGAETTSMAVFREGAIAFSNVRPWGAEYFTRDIAMVLGVELDEAEALKVSAGTCDPDRVLPGEIVQAGKRPRPYLRELVAKTLQARVKEFFELYRRTLIEAKVFDSIELVVLTGGGASLRGIDVAAGRMLGKRVRIGCPQFIEGDTPVLLQPDATVAMGLIRCAEMGDLSDTASYGKKPLPNFFGRLRNVFVGDY